MENLPFFRPWKLFPCGKTMTFGLQRTRRRKRRKINTNEKWWKIKMNISSHGKSMASVFQRRIITNEKLPRNNRKLTFFPILKTFSSRKINFWPSKNEKKEKKLLKRMKNCLKNDGKSRRILPFLPVENRGGFCLSKKNHHEWKIERRNNGKFTGIDVTFFPILKNFFLAEGKSAASGLREEKEEKEEEQPRIRLPGRNACAGGFVVEGWRGDGGGAVADTETSHFSWVWFASRDWPTAGSCSFVSAATYSRSPISAPLGSRTSRLFHRVDECDTVSRQFSCSLSSRDPSTEYNPGPVLSSSSKSREDVVVLVVNGMETYVAEIYSWVPDSLPNLDNKDFRNLLRSTKGIGIFVFYAGRILFYPRSRLSISLFSQ